MKSIESAEEFAGRIEDQAMNCPCVECFSPLIEERDNAVRIAARLELLAELRACAAACPGTGDERYEHLFSALEIRDKASQ